MKVIKENILCNALKTAENFDPVFNHKLQDLYDSDHNILTEVPLVDMVLNDFEVLNPYTIKVNERYYNIFPNRDTYYKNIDIISFSIAKINTSEPFSVFSHFIC